MTYDLRDTIFSSIAARSFTADVRVTTPGVICGVERAAQKARDLGCEVLHAAADGDDVDTETPILTIRGSAKAIAMAEDCVPGAVAKPSGISRAMRRAQQLAGSRVRVVSGAAKKMPEEVKDQIRRAVHRGGGSGRISEKPFLYLDKNYVRIFGSVRATLEAVAPMQGFVRAIQLRGLVEGIATEARAALDMGAEILMVDSGRLEDLDLVSRMVHDAGRRHQTTIAFAGDIAMDDIAGVAQHDVDILDIGRAILDAPIVDIKFDVRTSP
jgi:nicotinate-nucleotide pyrophosphorylase (carboxylating)